MLLGACVVHSGPGPGPRAERRAERRDDRQDARTEALTGWDKLGERWIQGGADHDRIHVGKKEGRFTRIQIVAEHSALELYDIVVTFGNGETFSPGTRLVFSEDTASRVIDLPGDARAIKHVDFYYGNLPGGGKAQLELWGR